MSPQHPVDHKLKSFVSTRLLFTRMDDKAATDALEFLGTVDPEDAAAPVKESAELVSV
ncbi:hypothetical protein IV500_06190 [Paeniglutamicibacter antarcticus]|uniref:Uncharacterized protein n=1 Tax=Arthrobacter terrae TaxID=2935737 RepID=A0A931CN75_9MICC|nr:hypothetical protein [Arthrobacter terrae]MBG0739011.1 hypothetical protein [Arthrobacter terrae]